MPLVADGIATSVWCGRCYYHLADVIAKGWNGLADVIANVADAICSVLGRAMA